jgi:hypothetical protein
MVELVRLIASHSWCSDMDSPMLGGELFLTDKHRQGRRDI